MIATASLLSHCGAPFSLGASRAICWSFSGPPRATARHTRATKRPWLSSRQVQTRRTDHGSDAWRRRDSCARLTDTGAHAVLPSPPRASACRSLPFLRLFRATAAAADGAQGARPRMVRGQNTVVTRMGTADAVTGAQLWPPTFRDCCGVFSTSLGCSLCLSNVVCCPIAVDFH